MQAGESLMAEVTGLGWTIKNELDLFTKREERWSPREHSCKERDTKSWEVWRRPEFGLDLTGKEELGRKIPRNFVLQVLPAY